MTPIRARRFVAGFTAVAAFSAFASAAMADATMPVPAADAVKVASRGSWRQPDRGLGGRALGWSACGDFRPPGGQALQVTDVTPPTCAAAATRTTAVQHR